MMLLLSVITMSCTALASEEHYAIQITIHASGREIPASIDIYKETEHIILLSSFMPDTGILISTPVQEDAGSVMENINMLTDESSAKKIGECIQEWINYMRPAKQNGVYSGNAFAEATEMQRVQISYSDLMLLIRRIRNVLPEGNTVREIIDTLGIDSIIPSRNISMDLKVFDDGKYLSIDVLEGEDAIATVSADIEDSSNILLITGVGMEGKNYYNRCIIDTTSENRLIITDKLYADDMKNGYLGLDNNALILSTVHEFELTGKPENPEEIGYNFIMTPANEITPVYLTAKLYPSNDEHVAECTLGFSAYDNLSANIEVSRSNERISVMPEKVIDIENMTDDDQEMLTETIQTALTPLMLQVMAALPEEYMKIILNMVQ